MVFKSLFRDTQLTMQLTVHHTCSSEGDLNEIIQQAPFYSTHDEKEVQFKFLGAGFYFPPNAYANRFNQVPQDLVEEAKAFYGHD